VLDAEGGETNFDQEHLWAWVMDANGGNATRLTTNEVAESEPLVSPGDAVPVATQP